MNSNLRTTLSTIIIVSCMLSSESNAQNVAEPPIPVYIVCPYHQDSLKNAYEHAIATNGSALTYTNKRFDTLQIQAQLSSAENTAHFTWLYSLIALLGMMNIVLLFSTSRIRKELAQLKRLEHQQRLSLFVPPAESQPIPQIQEALFSQEPSEIHKPTRTRRTPARKPRI